MKGKSADTFGPIGPWLVTTEEVPDPQALRLWLEVDGHRYQDGLDRDDGLWRRSSVSYLSRFMSLQPGDIISTGTPPGVGLGQKPPVYLRPGNVMRLGVEGLGEQRQTVVPLSRFARRPRVVMNYLLLMTAMIDLNGILRKHENSFCSDLEFFAILAYKVV